MSLPGIPADRRVVTVGQDSVLPPSVKAAPLTVGGAVGVASVVILPADAPAVDIPSGTLIVRVPDELS